MPKKALWLLIGFAVIALALSTVLVQLAHS